MLCPCGSNSSFSTCCQPFITKGALQKTPHTAEQLMRSRFSAYAIKDGLYIYNTYGEKQQNDLSVKELQSWAEECLWLALVVHNATKNTVDFSAFYVVDNTLYELREISIFEKQQINNQTQWRYIDGRITKSDAIASIKRNDICPCNHYPTAWSTKRNKRFKHCCGK